MSFFTRKKKEKPAAPAATTKYEAVSKEPEPVKEETDPVKDEAKEALLADEAPESPLTEPMVPVQTREPDPLKPTLLGDKEPEAVANAKAAPQGPQIPELANVEDKAVVRKEPESPARGPFMTEEHERGKSNLMVSTGVVGGIMVLILMLFLLGGILPDTIQRNFDSFIGRTGRFGGRVSTAPIMHYYMYRVQNDEDYSPENQNMANIAGALWYLHNEIVWHHWLRAGTFASTPKTRIERFLVFSRASQELYDKGMNFGVVNTYDLGKCSGPYKCENLQEYGPVVGCESWDPKQGNNFPHGQWTGKNVYPNAVWYSLPGKCSSVKFWQQQGDCSNHEPSGACPLGVVPTGEWTCTYTYQKVGEIRISEVENITDLEAFLEGGGREYNKETDKGIHLHFWDDIDDPVACQKRVDKVNKMFQKKYPDQPVLEDPSCDFNVGKFYPYFPEGVFHAAQTNHSTNGTTNNTNANVSNATRLLVQGTTANLRRDVTK